MYGNPPSSYLAISATTTLQTSEAIIDHILVSSTSSGTIKITDGAGTTVLDTTTPAANDDLPIYAKVVGPIVFTIASTLKVTIFYRA